MKWNEYIFIYGTYWRYFLHLNWIWPYSSCYVWFYWPSSLNFFQLIKPDSVEYQMLNTHVYTALHTRIFEKRRVLSRSSPIMCIFQKVIIRYTCALSIYWIYCKLSSVTWISSCFVLECNEEQKKTIHTINVN